MLSSIGLPAGGVRSVPAELREVLRANQRDGYGVLMQACAAAIIELSRDPRYVGGTVAVLAVLHTWTQQLNLHPHVHCLVSGGGISDDASTWHPARRKFLVPIKALAKVVHGKFRAMLRRKRPDLVISDAAWRTRWILHVTAWGNGEQAVLDYLARYVFRVALTNARIVGLDDQTVTIQYKERKTGHRRTCRLSGHEFIAASSNTCCRAASTRCATPACGIPHSATTPPGCGRCCNCRRHPSPAHHRSLSSRHPSSLPRHRCRRSSHGSVRTVTRGGWSSPVCSHGTHRARPWRHDQQLKPPTPPSPGLAAACLSTPRRSPVCTATDCPDFAPDDVLDRLERPAPDRDATIAPRRAPRLSRDYQPARRASLVKSP